MYVYLTRHSVEQFQKRNRSKMPIEDLLYNIFINGSYYDVIENLDRVNKKLYDERSSVYVKVKERVSSIVFIFDSSISSLITVIRDKHGKYKHRRTPVFKKKLKEIYKGE